MSLWHMVLWILKAALCRGKASLISGSLSFSGSLELKEFRPIPTDLTKRRKLCRLWFKRTTLYRWHNKSTLEISIKDQYAQKTNKFPNNMQNANNPYLIIYIKIKPKSLFCISVSLLRHTIKQLCVYFPKYTWFLQLTFDPDVKK